MIKPSAVVLFITNAKGEILSITRKGNEFNFGLVGGKIDETDSNSRAALNREVLEETGVDISSIPTELKFSIMDYSAIDNPILVDAYVLPVGTECLFPENKTLTPEGTYLQFLHYSYLLTETHSEFWEYNTELYAEIKAYLGV
jgi:8-oxo-dGTP pyrophosphatase MutT (NUDIX family)